MRALVSRLFRRGSPASLIPALVCVALASCGTSSQFKVVKQAAPNPFVGVEAFAIDPIQYVDLHVDGKAEAEYTAGFDQEKKAAWEGDKQNIHKVFAEYVVDASGEGVRLDDAATCRLRPIVREVESGYYRIPAWNAVTKIFMTVEITDSSGQVADEVFCSDGAAFDAVFNPTVGGRLGSVAKSLGKMVGNYLAERTGG